MDKMKLLISVILLAFSIGCTTSTPPLVASIKKQHLGDISETISKYRSLLIKDGWKLQASNISTSDSFLKAVKFYDKIMLYSLAVSLTVSCNQSSNKINCTTIISTSNQGPAKQRVLNNKELMQFVDKIKAL